MNFNYTTITFFICFALLHVNTYFAQAGTVIQDGIMSGQSNSVHAKIFKGTGTIQGENAYITCDEFLFTGTIDCSRECIIRCKKAFNVSQFTKKGTGKVTIIISPYAFEQCRLSELLNYAFKTLIHQTVRKDANSIAEDIQLIRYYAASNNIDEVELFALVIDKIEEQMQCVKSSSTESSKKIDVGDNQFKKIDEQIKYHTAHLDEKYDMRHVENVVSCSMMSALGVWACMDIYKKFPARYSMFKHPALSVAALFTLIFAAATADTFLKIINPGHKEKLEALIAQRTEMNMKQQQEKLEKSLVDPASTTEELTVLQMDALQALQTYKDMIQQALNQPFVMLNEQIITL